VKGLELLTSRRPSDRLDFEMSPGGSFVRAATRLAVTATVLFGIIGAANAETVPKQCGDQWRAEKANGTTNGQTWSQFINQCRAQLASTGSATAAPQGGFAPAAPPPSTAAPATGYAKTPSQCNAEYAARAESVQVVSRAVSSAG